MQELTDDQLDGLFRKSAEEFDTPFDPAAWQSLKNQLDAHDRVKPGAKPIWSRLLRWGLPALLLLLLTGGGWYAYRKVHPAGSTETGRDVSASLPPEPGQHGPTEPPQQAARIRPSEQQRIPVEVEGRAESAVEITKQPVESTALLANVDKPVNHLNERTVGSGLTEVSSADKATKGLTPAYGLKPVAASRPRTKLTVSTRAGRAVATGLNGQRSGLRSVKRGLSGPKQLKTANNHGRDEIAFSEMNGTLNPTPSYSTRPGSANPEGTSVVAPSSPGSTTALESSQTAPLGLPTINELAIRPGQWSKPLTLLNRPLIVRPDTVARVAAQKPTPPRGLSVRFVVSPDLSAVGLHNFTKPGTNVGLLVEYRLASRWSLQAGVIRSTKVYKALPSDYVVPEGMWMAPAKLPDRIDGRCNLLDIPLNIRYDFALLPRMNGQLPSRWFISGGLTTYIMNQEKYQYTYPPHTYGQNTEFNGSTGRYTFSQLNLSAGYERALSRRLSWQVEPFIKAPLRGVGFFKIDLLSTGAFLSLRYKL